MMKTLTVNSNVHETYGGTFVDSSDILRGLARI